MSGGDARQTVDERLYEYGLFIASRTVAGEIVRSMRDDPQGLLRLYKRLREHYTRIAADREFKSDDARGGFDVAYNSVLSEIRCWLLDHDDKSMVISNVKTEDP